MTLMKVIHCDLQEAPSIVSSSASVFLKPAPRPDSTSTTSYRTIRAGGRPNGWQNTCRVRGYRVSVVSSRLVCQDHRSDSHASSTFDQVKPTGNTANLNPIPRFPSSSRPVTRTTCAAAGREVTWLPPETTRSLRFNTSCPSSNRIWI